MPESGTASRPVAAAWARGVCAGMRAAGCQWVVYVPDNPLAHVLRVLADEYPDIRTIVATREEEAFGIAAGLYLGGARSAVMLQSSGLGNSLNVLGSLLAAYHIPALIVMSLRGGPGEWNEAQVPVGRAARAFLDAIGIQQTTADTADDAEGAVRAAGALAFGTRFPAACILPRALTAGGGRLERSPDRGAASGPPRHAGVIDAGRTEGPAVMSRLEATRLLVSRLRNEAVIATLGHPAYDLFAAGDRPENFYTWGSMGMAAPIGLGVALARPTRRVVVIDGDGSLLMNLGGLATIAVMRPPNLTLVVWDNGEYGTTGGQPSATASGADLTGAAAALGIPFAATVRTSGELSAALDRAAVERSPSAIVARVTESAPAAKPPLDCVFLKQRFMAALDAPEAATSGGPA